MPKFDFTDDPKWMDPKPWVDRSEGDEYRHAQCRFPDAHGCTYEPRTKEQYDAEEETP